MYIWNVILCNTEVEIEIQVSACPFITHLEATPPFHSKDFVQFFKGFIFPIWLTNFTEVMGLLYFMVTREIWKCVAILYFLKNSLTFIFFIKYGTCFLHALKLNSPFFKIGFYYYISFFTLDFVHFCFTC